MDGSNGSTTFVDSSSRARTMSSVSSAISTAQSRFGGASGLFPATQTAGSLKVNGASDLSLGAGDFTVECWIYNNGNLPVGYKSGIVYWAENVSSDFYWYIDSVYFSASGKGDTAHGLPLNQWSHIACVRAANVMAFYVNGAQVGTSWTRSVEFTSAVEAPKIGVGSNANRGLATHMDELRITKGVARYTANFTPPPAPFPDTGPAP